MPGEMERETGWPPSLTKLKKSNIIWDISNIQGKKEREEKSLWARGDDKSGGGRLDGLLDDRGAHLFPRSSSALDD